MTSQNSLGELFISKSPDFFTHEIEKLADPWEIIINNEGENIPD